MTKNIIAIFISSFLCSGLLVAQNQEAENEKEIKELQSELQELTKMLESTDEGNKSTIETTDDDLKYYLKEILEQTKQTNQSITKNSVAPANQGPEKVVVYIKEIDELRKQNEAMQAELSFMRKQVLELSDRVDRTERKLAKPGEGNNYSSSELSSSEIGKLNENLEKLREDLQFIQKQNLVANEKLEVISELPSSNVNELDTKVTKLEKETDEIKEKVDQIEKNASKYTVLETTRESISDRELMNKEDLPLGYYVIIASERSYNRAFLIKKRWKNKGVEAKIIQNKKQTWYHLFTERVDTRQEAGSAVAKTRKNGISDAWWLKN